MASRWRPWSLGALQDTVLIFEWSIHSARTLTSHTACQKLYLIRLGDDHVHLVNQLVNYIWIVGCTDKVYIIQVTNSLTKPDRGQLAPNRILKSSQKKIYREGPVDNVFGST